MFKNKFKYHYLFILLIFVLALGMRCYRVQDKHTLFIDENLSIVLSNYAVRGWSWPVVAHDDEKRTFEGKELKELIFGDDNSLQNIAYDIWNLRKWTRDTPHTNLYYTFLRLSFFQADTADLDSVVNRAFWLNVLFFAIGFIFLYRLAKLLFPDKWVLAVCILGIAYLNPVSISNTLFMREYQLQETLFLVLIYHLVVLVKRVINKEKVFQKKRDYISTLIVTSLALLPGYFGVPYVLMMWGGLFLTVLIVERFNNPKLLGRLALICLGAIVLLLCIYPTYFNTFFEDRGTEAFEKMTFASFGKGMSSVWNCLVRFVGTEGLILFSLFFIGAGFILIKKRKNLNKNNLIIFYIVSCSIFWMLFTLNLAPEKEIRYVASAFPLAYLLFPLVLSYFSFNIQKTATPLLIIYFLFKSITSTNVYWGIDDLGDYYRKDVNTPLVIGGIFSPWMQTSLTPFFTEGRTIHFTLGSQEFQDKINAYDEVYVIVGGEQMVEIALPTNYEIVNDSIFEGEEFLAGERYKIKRKSNDE